MKVIAVIPARYTSTRLPGKPLADICGKPMIQHVYELISRAEGLDDIVVATDDARIADAVRAFGGKVFGDGEERGDAVGMEIGAQTPSGTGVIQG